MKKNYEVTLGMISLLKEGQTFKNFAELSNTLGVLDSHGKPISGNSKMQFLNSLARFTVLKNDGRKITIEKIRSEDEILPAPPPKGNRKYVDLIQRLLVYHFNALCEATQCDGIKILWGKKDIWQACGMVNDAYRWYGKMNGTESDEVIADAFRKLAGGIKLKSWLDSALSGLKKNDALVYTEKRAFVCYDGGDVRIVPLTEKQDVLYMRLHAETLSEYYLLDGETHATERDLLVSGRIDEFYSKLNLRLREAFGFDKTDKPIFIQNVYEIIVEPTTMKLFSQRFGKIDSHDTDLAIQMMSQLNSLVCDGLMSAISLDREVAVAKRVRNHKDVVDHIENQRLWGGSQFTKKELENRREFQYDHLSLSKEQKGLMVDKTIRLSEGEIRNHISRDSHDVVSSCGCFVLEKMYIDGFLHGSGLTEEQYEKIIQIANEESEKERVLEQLTGVTE